MDQSDKVKKIFSKESVGTVAKHIQDRIVSFIDITKSVQVAKLNNKMSSTGTSLSTAESNTDTEVSDSYSCSLLFLYDTWIQTYICYPIVLKQVKTDSKTVTPEKLNQVTKSTNSEVKVSTNPIMSTLKDPTDTEVKDSSKPKVSSDSSKFDFKSNTEVSSSRTIIATDKKPNLYDSVSRKKRFCEANEFDFVFDQVLVLNSKAAEVRRQQIKILNLVKRHEGCMKSLTLHGDKRVKKVIVDYSKSQSPLRLFDIDEGDKEKLLKEPGIFQHEFALTKDEFHYAGHTWGTYSDFLEEEENNACKNAEACTRAKAANHPFLRMPNLIKCGGIRCSGCSKPMSSCDDVVIGPYCVFRVVKLCTENYDMLDNVVIKKVFIDTYNRILAYNTFKLGKGSHDDWVYPPPCVQDNTFRYAVFFYEWVIEGQWSVDKSSDEEDSEEE